MNIEQQQHLACMRRAYIKRLRVLELKEAQQGIDTQPHIVNEIEELREKITKIDMLLMDIENISSDHHNAVLQNAVTTRSQVEIVFRGHFNKLTPEIQTAAIRALAAIMEIPYEQVIVMSVKSGSIILHIEVPEQALRRLIDLYQADDPILQELEIIRINTVDVFRGFTPSSCPNCNSTKSGTRLYRCSNGHIYCDSCAKIGLAYDYCPKCREKNTGQRIGVISSR